VKFASAVSSNRRSIDERSSSVGRKWTNSRSALCPRNGEQPGVALVGVGDQLPVFQEGLALLDRPFPLSLGGVSPRVPVDRAEVVQREPPLLGLWCLDHTPTWVAGT